MEGFVDWSGWTLCEPANASYQIMAIEGSSYRHENVPLHRKLFGEKEVIDQQTIT